MCAVNVSTGPIFILSVFFQSQFTLLLSFFFFNSVSAVLCIPYIHICIYVHIFIFSVIYLYIRDASTKPVIVQLCHIINLRQDKFINRSNTRRSSSFIELYRWHSATQRNYTIHNLNEYVFVCAYFSFFLFLPLFFFSCTSTSCTIVTYHRVIDDDAFNERRESKNGKRKNSALKGWRTVARNGGNKTGLIQEREREEERERFALLMSDVNGLAGFVATSPLSPSLPMNWC